MTDFTPEEQQRRDDLLCNLLKTPPQPRPKRERGSKTPPKAGEEVSLAPSGKRGGARSRRPASTISPHD